VTKLDNERQAALEILGKAIGEIIPDFRASGSPSEHATKMGEALKNAFTALRQPKPPCAECPYPEDAAVVIGSLRGTIQALVRAYDACPGRWCDRWDPEDGSPCEGRERAKQCTTCQLKTLINDAREA
jgi:hypothetical protein